MLPRATSGVSRATCKSKKMRSGFAMRPEAYCTLSSRSMVSRVASPLASARIRRTRGISRDPGRLTDLPPACTGALARAASAVGKAAVESGATLFVADCPSSFCSSANSASASCASRFLGERG